MGDLLLTDWVTKVKPDMNSIEVHPQQSHIRHPVHGVVVGAGSLWPFIGTVPTRSPKVYYFKVGLNSFSLK
jgi:hypothetical protein